MDPLIKKRGTIKAALTRVENHLITVKDDQNPDLNELKCKLQKLEKCSADYEAVHTEINLLCVDEAEITKQEKEYEEFDTKLDKAIATIQSLIEAASPTPSTISHNSIGINSTGGSSGTTPINMTADIKLPKLDLPTFNGESHQWIPFRDLFTSTIHNNPKLGGAQKLQYLKASLKDQASTLLSSLQITDDNYAEAWEILTKRYENKREIVRAHLKRFFNQPNVTTETSESIRKVLDTTNEVMRSLKVMKLPVEHSRPLT
jgi:hypothetical protein